MSTFHDILARAEQNEASHAAEVSSLAASRALLKDAEDDAKREHRRARGAVIRLRGALDAVSRLPEAAQILGDDPAPAAAESVLDGLGLRAGQEGEPPLVDVAPVAPFTPALYYPAEHPVEPPRRESNVRPIAAASAIEAITSPPVARTAPESSRPARPNSKKVRVLADDILERFRKVRLNAYASLEMDELCMSLGKAPKAIDAALADLKERKLIQPVRAARGHRTVKLLDGAMVAA